MSDLMTIYQPLATNNPKQYDSTKSPLALLAETCRNIGADSKSSLRSIDHTRKPDDSSTRARKDGRRSGNSDLSPASSTPEKQNASNVSRPASGTQPQSRPGSNASQGKSTKASFKPYDELRSDEKKSAEQRSTSDNRSATSPSTRKSTHSPKASSKSNAHQIAAAQQQLLESKYLQYQYQQYLAAMAGYGSFPAAQAATTTTTVSSAGGSTCPPGCTCPLHMLGALSPFSAHFAALAAQYPNVPPPHLLNMYSAASLPGYSPFSALPPHLAHLNPLNTNVPTPVASSPAKQENQPPTSVAQTPASHSTKPSAHACHWPTATGLCAKRFSTAEELLAHSRTHAEAPASYEQLYAGANYEQLLASQGASHRRTAFDPVSSSTASRYHPYSKPTTSSSASNAPNSYPSAAAYNPHTAAAAAAAAAINPAIAGTNPLLHHLSGAFSPFAGLGAFGLSTPGANASTPANASLQSLGLGVTPVAGQNPAAAAAAAAAAYNMYGAYAAAGRMGPPVQQ